MIYVIQVTPMNELKVRAALEREGIWAYVPRRELIIRKSGGWTKAVPVMLPSYVFLDCDYCPEIHHIVRSVDVLSTGWASLHLSQARKKHSCG